MNKFYALLLRPVFSFLYIIGLSFIIPYLLSTQLPEELATRYSSANFLIISIILLLTAIIGTFIIREEELGKTFKSLGFYSLIPGILSVITALFGKDLLINLLTKYNKAFEPLIISYINSKITKLWFLTAAYIVLGIAFYYIGRKLK